VPTYRPPQLARGTATSSEGVSWGWFAGAAALGLGVWWWRRRAS
jgi:hypothetical protein